MNIAYIGDSAYRTVIEHSHNITLSINEDTEAVLVESALMEGPPELPVINTCPGVRALGYNKELKQAFDDAYGIATGYPSTFLYGFFSEDGMSEMIEMTFKTRFLTGDIGPVIPFCQGTGLACRENPLYALPKLNSIVEGLKEIGYKGEIAFGVTKEFDICSIFFGHFTLGFTLYTELSRTSPQHNYEWCLGVGDSCRLHQNGIAVATLLSYPPYPYDTNIGTSIKAPSKAEKHLYRFMVGNTELALAATWGEDISEAKRRIRGTIENCKNYNKEIQYRIDYGHKERFVINNDTWLAFGGVEPRN